MLAAGHPETVIRVDLAPLGELVASEQSQGASATVATFIMVGTRKMRMAPSACTPALNGSTAAGAVALRPRQPARRIPVAGVKTKPQSARPT